MVMTENTLFEKSRRSTAFVLPTSIVTKLFGILYVLLLTRSLSVDQYGTYNFFIGLITVFAFLCNFGLQSTLQRFIPRYSAEFEWKRLLKLIYFAHGFRFVLSVFFLFLAYFFYKNWAVEFGVEAYKDEYTVFAIGAFMLFQVLYFSTEFNALMMHGTTSLIELAMSALKLLIVYGVLSSGMGLVWVFWGEMSAYTIALLFAVYSFFLNVYKPSRQHILNGPADSVEYRRLFRYTSYNAIVAPGAIMFSHSMDVFIIAALAGQHEVGLYALASRASQMLISVMPHTILQGVIRTVFYHQYSLSDNSDAQLSTMFQSILVLAACIIFPVLLVSGVVSEPLIVHVFGEKYSEAVMVFVVLLVFNIFTILDLPANLVLQSIEKVEVLLYAQVFAVYNVVAAILLMPHYGLLGVAFATGSALMFKCLYLYIMVYRYTRIKITWVPLLKVSINSIIAAFAAYFVIGSSMQLIDLMLALSFSIVCYLVMSYFNNFMDDFTKVLINRFLKKEVFKVVG